MDPPIWTKNECGAEATINLINSGIMDLTKRESFQNGTVLHLWAGTPYDFYNSHQQDSLAVVKLLVDKGADLLALDSWRSTPLLEAANGRSGERPNLEVLDYLLEMDVYSQAEKIEAMELAGAVIIGYKKNASQFHKAFDYWRKALQLRQMDIEGCGPIQKTRLNLKSVRTSIEWTTLAELEAVIEQPETYVIQSFLVRLRIFSNKDWEAIKSLFWYFLPDTFLRELRQQRRFIEMFDIIWAMLETPRRLDPCEMLSLQKMKDRVVGKLFRELSFLLRDSPEFCNAEIIETSLDLIVSATGSHGIGFPPLISIFKLISHLPPRLLNKGTMEILSQWCDQRGKNLLHRACISGETLNYNPDFNNLYTTVRVLLNAGCDPNTIDQDGNTPLHYLAQLDELKLKGSMTIAARLLLDFGAQLTLKNADGKTAVDFWIQKNGRKRLQNEDGEGDEIIDWKLAEWCSEIPTLTSLCARVIRHNRIPHLELPATLIPIIEKHKIPVWAKAE